MRLSYIVREHTDDWPNGKPNSTPSLSGSSALMIVVSSAMVLSPLQLQGVVFGRSDDKVARGMVSQPYKTKPGSQITDTLQARA